MEIRYQRFLLMAVMVGGLWLGFGVYTLPAYAQSMPEMVIQPELARSAVNEARIDTEDWELGMYAGLMSIEDFGVNSALGARLAYHMNRDFFIEATYGKSTADRTSYENLSGSVELLTADERNLTYYNVSVGYNLFPGEVFVGHRYAFYSDLYVIFGIGSTEFGGDDHYTMNAGAGYRFVATDWMALHFDFRDHVFESDLLGSVKTTHNFESTLGLTVFF